MTEIFIDTNAFMHFLTKGEKWGSVFKIINNPSYSFHTSITVLNELRFSYQWNEASIRLNTNKKYVIIQYIKTNKKFIEETYKKYVTFLLYLRELCTIHGVNAEDEIVSCKYAVAYSLLPSDSSILATMKKNNIKKILTFDRDFEKIEGIEVVK